MLPSRCAISLRTPVVIKTGSPRVCWYILSFARSKHFPHPYLSTKACMMNCVQFLPTCSSTPDDGFHFNKEDQWHRFHSTDFITEQLLNSVYASVFSSPEEEDSAQPQSFMLEPPSTIPYTLSVPQRNGSPKSFKTEPQEKPEFKTVVDAPLKTTQAESTTPGVSVYHYNQTCLQVHRRQDREGNKEKRFQCKYCPKSFYSQSHQDVHERIHTGEKPYVSCHDCYTPI